MPCLPHLAFRQRPAEGQERETDTMRHLRTNPVHTVKDILSISSMIINADGAARGNPGPAAIGVTIKDAKGNLIASLSRRIGKATNNQAEYRAIIAGLEEAIKLGIRQAKVLSDSELVVKQINGKYRVKNIALRYLYERAVKLIGSLEDFSIQHVPRGRSAEVDYLANQALDRK
jgi:ribonuclease HI